MQSIGYDRQIDASLSLAKAKFLNYESVVAMPGNEAREKRSSNVFVSGQHVFGG